MIVQVKYTNQTSSRAARGAGMYDFRSEEARPAEPARAAGESLSSSGSDQAREGRLVDALAARGDEGRDTLR